MSWNTENVQYPKRRKESGHRGLRKQREPTERNRRWFKLKKKYNISRLWDANKVVLRGKFKALNAYARK